MTSRCAFRQRTLAASLAAGAALIAVAPTHAQDAASQPAASQPSSAPMTTGPAPLWNDDLEHDGPLTSRWRGAGQLNATRVTLPDDQAAPGASGRVLSVRPSKNARLESSPLPADLSLTAVESLRITARAPAGTPGQKTAFDVLFVSRERAAWKFRRIVLVGAEWRTFTLPLRYFRSSAGAELEWREVDRIALRFHSERAEIQVDGLQLLPGATPHSAEVSPEELGRFAFGADKVVQRIDCPPFVVLTDSGALDRDALAGALANLVAAAKRDMPDAPLPARPRPLLIFATQTDYQAFWPRFADMFDARLVPPATDGYSALGVASSACGDETCGVRPVFVHEAAHNLLAGMLGLASRGDWLHEGLAARYQLEFSKEDLRPVIQAGLKNPAARLPVDKLLSGEEVPAEMRWQAALMVEFLLENPAHRRELLRVLPELRRQASSDLRPWLEGRFDRTPEELEPEWLKWAQRKYGS